MEGKTILSIKLGNQGVEIDKSGLSVCDNDTILQVIGILELIKVDALGNLGVETRLKEPPKEGEE